MMSVATPMIGSEIIKNFALRVDSKQAAVLKYIEYQRISIKKADGKIIWIKVTKENIPGLLRALEVLELEMSLALWNMKSIEKSIALGESSYNKKFLEINDKGSPVVLEKTLAGTGYAYAPESSQAIQSGHRKGYIKKITPDFQSELNDYENIVNLYNNLVTIIETIDQSYLIPRKSLDNLGISLCRKLLDDLSFLGEYFSRLIYSKEKVSGKLPILPTPP